MIMAAQQIIGSTTLGPRAPSFWARLGKDLKKNYGAYLFLVPAILFYVLFCYKPMYGIVIAFKNYSPGKSFSASPWVGFRHFTDFFDSYYFGRLIRNTLTISLSSIIFGFPAPIIFALLLNEIENSKFKRLTQTITYAPHFISMVIVGGLIKIFTSSNGIITQVLMGFGYSGGDMLAKPSMFVPIHVISGIWQNVGWGSIIYLSALTSIDPELYEAAGIDGANRWRQVLHITLPGIMNTVIIMLILRMGSIMNVGYEKIILLYNESIYETADVISTFVYRKGLQQFQWSYSTAVGLFNSVINFLIVYVFNRISRKVSEVSLW